MALLPLVWLALPDLWKPNANYGEYGPLHDSVGRRIVRDAPPHR